MQQKVWAIRLLAIEYVQIPKTQEEINSPREVHHIVIINLRL